MRVLIVEDEVILVERLRAEGYRRGDWQWASESRSRRTQLFKDVARGVRRA
jgi:hypothetical protein